MNAGHGCHIRRRQTYLDFRVEGVARELKPDLVISLKSTQTILLSYKHLLEPYKNMFLRLYNYIDNVSKVSQ